MRPQNLQDFKVTGQPPQEMLDAAAEQWQKATRAYKSRVTSITNSLLDPAFDQIKKGLAQIYAHSPDQSEAALHVNHAAGQMKMLRESIMASAERNVWEYEYMQSAFEQMAKKPGEIDYESIAQHTFHATKEQNIYAHRAKRSPYFEQLWVERFNEAVLQFPFA